MTLAINRGTPVREKAFAPWPCFDQQDMDAVSNVLQSGKVNYWTGEQGKAFEREFADYVDARFGIAMANGTVTLEVALRALGVGPGDHVVVPCKTFIATASSVVMCGAIPIISDIDPVTQNVTAKTLKDVLTPETKAIIVVHLLGLPCEMDPILKLARERGVFVVEDCAQAHGAMYHGKKVGSLGDIASFSFCQDKIMTTGGEGGMITTNDEKLWKKAWALKDHGKDYDLVHQSQVSPGFRWLHQSFGTNARMTEMQAALGRNALKKLDDWLQQRRRNAQHLQKAFQSIKGLQTLPESDLLFNAYYKYYVLLDVSKLKLDWNRQGVIDAIVSEGVPCFSGICSEIYREAAFESLGWKSRPSLPGAVEAESRCLMFLVHPTLGEQEMEDTVTAVRKVLSEALIQGESRS